MSHENAKVAVVIGGCGYLDGTEITEAVSALINLGTQGLSYQCYAPNADFSPVDHISGEPAGPARNLMTEAARICRGAILPLTDLSPENHEALVMPGGYGAAKSLSDFATSEQPKVIPDLASAIRGFHEAQKPIVAVCIAPALLALTLGKQGVTLTIGSDEGTAAKLASFGAKHQTCAVDEIAIDGEHKLITAPAYMYEANPAEVHSGITKAIAQLKGML